MRKADLQALIAHLPNPTDGGTWRETDFAEFNEHQQDDRPVLTFEYTATEDDYEAVWLVVDTTTDPDDGAADAAYAVGLDHALGVGL